MQLLNANYQISKAVRSERQRLDSLLATQERSIQNAFKVFLTQTRSDATLRVARQFLERNDIAAALDVVTQHVVPLGRTIAQSFADVALSETKALGAKVSSSSAVGVSFDPGSARAAALIRANQLQFIQQFTDNQRNATRVALADAASRGANSAETAQAFKDSIGLTQAQMQAVNNYRTALGTNSAAALDRELRDRRFDRTVNNAITINEPLSPAQIDRMVARYQANMLTQRAETIALTEGHAAMSAAQDESIRQTVDQAGFDPSVVQRTWNTVLDGRERDSHAGLDGQVVGLDEPFVTDEGVEIMYPGDPDAPANERIRCRCTLTIDFNGGDTSGDMSANVSD